MENKLNFTLNGTVKYSEVIITARPHFPKMLNNDLTPAHDICQKFNNFKNNINSLHQYQPDIPNVCDEGFTSFEDGLPPLVTNIGLKKGFL